MQRVHQKERRDKTVNVAMNELEKAELIRLSQWYFKGSDKKSRKGHCLLARMFIEDGIRKMQAEMQADMNRVTTATEV